MMKLMKTLAAAAVVASCVPAAFAGTYTFSPTPADLYDLDHYYNYTWGINWTAPAGEQITAATLSIKNINNWTYEPNANWLYMHLLDNVAPGVSSMYDNQAGGDQFAGQGKLIAVYTDNDTAYKNLSYNFDSNLLSSLKTYSADSKWGFGFDPDCHYYNDCISFTVCTEKLPTPPVPEPMSMVLSAMGLSSLVGLRRFKKA